jgi:hypothetical protein
MTLQDMGSIGELLAAVATIATLVYLARQLRANTAAVQGESRRAHRAASSAANLTIASDANVAALFNTGLADFDAMDATQHTQFSFLMAELFGSWEAAHQEFETGIVDKFQVDSMVRSHLPFLRTPGGGKWWDTYRNSYPQSFRKYVDVQIQTSQPVAPPQLSGHS